MIRELVEAVRRPEYTGENRCPPCTVVNVAIAVVLGNVVSRKSKPAGVLVLALSMATIYLRGYLVPGTPELTKRYLPPTVLGWFGKSPEPELATGVEAIDESNVGNKTNEGSLKEGKVDDGRMDEGKVDEDGAAEDGDGDGAAEDGDEDGAAEDGDEDGAEEDGDGDEVDISVTEASVPDDLEAYLVDAGILEPCEDRDDLCLTPSFESEWLDAIETVDDSTDLVATAAEVFGFAADPAVFELEEAETGARVLTNGSRHAGKWPSHAAFLADVSAGTLLESWLEEWVAYSPRQRGQLLNSLRMFLETCPIAGGDVRVSEDVVESCCTSSTVIAVVCEETGERLFEHQIEGDASHLMD